MGSSGSVSYMFDRKGYLVLDRTKNTQDEDTVLMDIMDLGADDLQTSDDAYEIYTEAKDFAAVRDGLIEKGYEIADAELTMIPQNTTPVPEEKQEQFEHMIDQLEDDEDVSEVYTAAADNDEE